MLTFSSNDELCIFRYSDLDFMGSMDDIKFILGYVFKIADRAISWKSVTQIITASSIMYAEFMACNALKEYCISVTCFVFPFWILRKIYSDNSLVLFFSKNNKRSIGLKAY